MRSIKTRFFARKKNDEKIWHLVAVEGDKAGQILAGARVLPLGTVVQA